MVAPYLIKTREMLAPDSISAEPEAKGICLYATCRTRLYSVAVFVTLHFCPKRTNDFDLLPPATLSLFLVSAKETNDAAGFANDTVHSELIS